MSASLAWVVVGVLHWAHEVWAGLYAGKGMVRGVAGVTHWAKEVRAGLSAGKEMVLLAGDVGGRAWEIGVLSCGGSRWGLDKWPQDTLAVSGAETGGYAESGDQIHGAVQCTDCVGGSHRWFQFYPSVWDGRRFGFGLRRCRQYARGPMDQWLSLHCRLQYFWHFVKPELLLCRVPQKAILVGSDEVPSLMGDGREGPYHTTVRPVSDQHPVRGYFCTAAMLR